MKSKDIVSVNTGRPRPEWLGRPGTWIREWEEAHLSAPAMRQEYDALRRVFSTIVDVLRKNAEEHGEKVDDSASAESSNQWWDHYIPAYVWLMAHNGGETEFQDLTDAIVSEVQERFLPRVSMYAAMLQNEKVLSRLDGGTGYHVKRVIKAMKARKQHKNK